MASSIAEITMPRSIDFSRATASAICSSSSLLALTAMAQSPSVKSVSPRRALSAARRCFLVFSGAGFFGDVDLFGFVLFGFGFSRDALGRLLFRMRCRRRFKPEAALQFALGGLAAPHRFRDQFICQNQPRFGDIFHG